MPLRLRREPVAVDALVVLRLGQRHRHGVLRHPVEGDFRTLLEIGGRRLFAALGGVEEGGGIGGLFDPVAELRIRVVGVRGGLEKVVRQNVVGLDEDPSRGVRLHFLPQSYEGHQELYEGITFEKDKLYNEE